MPEILIESWMQMTSKIKSPLKAKRAAGVSLSHSDTLLVTGKAIIATMPMAKRPSQPIV